MPCYNSFYYRCLILFPCLFNLNERDIDIPGDLCSGLLAPMLSFDPAVQDCGEVSLSLSVSEPKFAADTFLLDMVVRDTAYSPILMPFHNKTRESVAQCKLDFFVAENVTLTFRDFKKILNPSWLNRRGKIIGGWVEVDRWLQNFCSEGEGHVG